MGGIKCSSSTAYLFNQGKKMAKSDPALNIGSETAHYDQRLEINGGMVDWVKVSRKIASSFSLIYEFQRQSGKSPIFAFLAAFWYRWIANAFFERTLRANAGILEPQIARLAERMSQPLAMSPPPMSAETAR
jgi:hypothetical protein